MTRGSPWFVFALALVASGCSDGEKESATETGPVACFLADEAANGFYNYVLGEVALVSDPAHCGEEGLCMGYHFQGRVTCPYGQTQAEIDTLPADDPARCRTPDLEGNLTDEALALPVEPQLVERRAEDVVYCTCQCAGGDPSFDYCDCAAGFECADVFAFPGGLTRYCLRAGTEYDQTMPPSTATCDKNGTAAATDCGNRRRNP